jgi:hypothetical protein
MIIQNAALPTRENAHSPYLKLEADPPVSADPQNCIVLPRERLKTHFFVFNVAREKRLGVRKFAFA